MVLIPKKEKLKKIFKFRFGLEKKMKNLSSLKTKSLRNNNNLNKSMGYKKNKLINRS